VKYESKFEERLAAQLQKKGVKFTYESETWKYEKKPYNATCLDCGSRRVMETRDYTPDFFLPSGIVVEAKGKFTSPMRTKLLAVRESNPDRDLRIVFQRDNPLTSTKKKTYTGWAKQKGFKCAVGEIPDDWL
jgi:hypothetical protein